MIYCYLNDWERIRKMTTQEIIIKKITHEKESMPFGSHFCMVFNKWIREIGIIFCEQEEPPEKKIGDRSIVSYFLGNHTVYWINESMVFLQINLCIFHPS